MTAFGHYDRSADIFKVSYVNGGVIMDEEVTRRQFLRRAGLAAGSVAVAGSMAESMAAWNPDDVFAANSNTLTISQEGGPSGFHVLTAADGNAYEMIGLMFASLTRLNDKLEPVPELATKWDISSDGLRYTFHLNPKAKWHDGKPVTAHDVAFTYNLVAHPAIPATYYSRLTSIKGFVEYHEKKAKSVSGIRVLNAHTVQFVLKQRDAPFLSNLARQTFGCNEILPSHILGSVPASQIEKHPYWNHPIGSGPFKFVKYVPDQYLQLEAFPSYVLGAPKVKTLFVRFGAQEVLVGQLKTGEVDFAAVPPTDVHFVKPLKNIKIVEKPEILFESIYPNNTRPFLKDVRVRRAIAYAIDRPAMVKSLLLGHGKVVVTPITAPAWATDTNVHKYPYNPAMAKQLLTEAKWDSSRTLVMRSGTAGENAQAPLIQAYLQAVGIQTKIVTSDFPTVVKDLESGNFDLALIEHLCGFDPDYTAIWSSRASWPPNGNNFMRFYSPEVEKLLAEGRSTLDQAKRKAIYDKYQQVIVNDLVMIWLYFANDIYGVNSRVKGYRFAPFTRFWNIEQWSA